MTVWGGGAPTSCGGAWLAAPGKPPRWGGGAGDDDEENRLGCAEANLPTTGEAVPVPTWRAGWRRRGRSP